MKLKYLLLASLLFLTVGQAQIKQRFPSAVRYIAGYYINSQPYHPTLEAALNNVKAYATADSPYVFWLMGDTLRIADWDSVFTGSGLTMKDSIDQYYVSSGKIKWAGFGFGGGSGTSTTIVRPNQTTVHYNYPAWDQFSASFPYWQRDLGKALDSIDQHIYDLIVYTKDPLYIENDTLKIDTTGFGSTASSGWNPDTTRVMMVDRAQNVTAVKTWLSGFILGTGSYIQMPSTNNSSSTARILWGYNNGLYYNGSGADSSKIVMIDVNADTTRDVAFISYYDLNQALKDTLTNKQQKVVTSGEAWFANQDTSKTIAVAGLDTSGVVVVTPISTHGVDEVLSIVLGNNTFDVRRPASGRANLKFNWIWIKP